MAEPRVLRQDMDESDPLVALGTRVLGWVKSHRRLLSYSVTGCLVVLVLGSSWRAWRTHRGQAAEAALYVASKALTGPTADRTKAFALLQKVVNDYGTTSAGAVASWQLGHLYFEDAGYAAALTAYQHALRYVSKSTQPLVYALIVLDTAYAQEASGACDPAAIASFEAVLALPAVWLRSEAYSGMGRCYETTQALPQALAVYERALADDKLADAARPGLTERVLLLHAALKERK